MVTAETYPCANIFAFIHVKVSFEKRIRYFPMRNFRLLYYPGMWKYYNTLESNFYLSIVCQADDYGRLKTKENFKLLALKVVAGGPLQEVRNIVIWFGNLFLWKTGCWWKVVAATRGGRNQMLDCSRRSQIKYSLLQMLFFSWLLQI